MDTGPADSTYHFQECLENKHIEAVHRALKTLCAERTPVKIDISRIIAIDTVGVQLLLVLCQESADRVTPAKPVGYSAAVAKALTGLGLEDSTLGRHVNAQ